LRVLVLLLLLSCSSCAVGFVHVETKDQTMDAHCIALGHAGCEFQEAKVKGGALSTNGYEFLGALIAGAVSIYTAWLAH
jgi:hypothetical protein